MSNIRKIITPVEIVLILVLMLGISIFIGFKLSEDKETVKSNNEQNSNGVVSLSYIDGYNLQIHNVEYNGLEPGREYDMKLTVTDETNNKKLDELYYSFTPKIPEGVLELAVYYNPEEFGGKTITFTDKVLD